MPWAVVTPVVIAVAAFGLRVAVHAGRSPGGVDTWYYLAYAEAFRRRPSFDVRLPQYLLQDERQSYPPFFPSLLALLPSHLLRRHYWVISPAIDCLHLLLLYSVALRLTASVGVAAIAALTYAVTPQLVSETRSLSARPFGALLASAAIILLFKFTLSGGQTSGAAGAIAAAALLFLSSAAMSGAYGFVCAVLAIAFADPRYLFVPAGGLALAIVASAGHMIRVIRNYVQALAYWRRNRREFGAHPIRDSPVLGAGTRGSRSSWRQPGFMGGSVVHQVVRLVGENPFLLALPFVSRNVGGWSLYLYWWAVALSGLSVLATILPPLSAFGPGRSYMKAAIFPTAYSLAAGIGTPAGLLRPLGLITLSCLAASLAAIGVFFVYVRGRPTEQTAAVPPALRDAVRVLADLPAGGVFVLPYMYADYVCYWSGKSVLWGGHCGNHLRFEWIAPVIKRPLQEMLPELGVRYVLLDERFVKREELRLGARLETHWSAEGFEVHRLTPGGPTKPLDARP